ncbi:MAG: hypothetical protein ACK4SA_15280 [Caldilinea sp.]
MSQSLVMQTELKDLRCIQAAVQKIEGAKYCGIHTVHFYDGLIVTGHKIELPGFRYPVVIKADGSLACDTHKVGDQHLWGNPKLLDQLKQNYSVSVAETFAHDHGYGFTVEHLPNGVVRCVVDTGEDTASESGPSMDVPSSGGFTL